MKRNMMRSSLGSLSWIQHVLCIYWFRFTCCFQHSTEAKCQVTTKHGKEMVLGVGPFPQGIFYDETNDRLICDSPRSCEKYIITGCSSVRCERAYACRGAHLSHITYLGCYGYDSCVDVTVTDTEMMHCGPSQTAPAEGYRTFCERANIQIKNNVLNCMGPGSCYAQLPHDRIVVNVGSEATVSCGSSTVNGGKACGNMVIEVNHASRACYATDLYQNCAVLCDKKEDCDTAAIEFRVVGQ